jgi:hypothetical protein
MTAAGLRATAKAVEHPPEPKVGAPVLDPTSNAVPEEAIQLEREVNARLPHVKMGCGEQRNRKSG